MTLLERMVLILLDTAGTKPVPAPTLLSVCSVMDKRYDLEWELTDRRMVDVLDGLHQESCIERYGHGFRIAEGGKYHLESIRRKQGPFIRKVLKDVATINPVFAAAS